MLALTLGFAALALLFAPSFSECGSAHASDTQPGDYCYQTDVAITYSGAGTLTNYPVRVEMNASGQVAANQMDPRAWDLKPILGSIANEVHLTAQDMTASDAAFWIVVPEISASQTRTHRIYSGSAEQRRDQSIYFTGNEDVTIGDDAALDISDNLQIDLTLFNFSNTVRDEYLLDHLFTGAGYSVQFEDVAAALNITFNVDGSACQLPWDSAWTDERQNFSFQYVAAAGADAFIYRNGALATSCDTDAGAIGAPLRDLIIGDNSLGTLPLSDAAIATVIVSDTGDPQLHLTFNAAGMVETVATNPFQGTVQDHSANDFTATYTFDRAQTNLSYTVGATQLVSDSNQITLPDANIDVLGPAFGLDPAGNSETTTGAFYTVFVDKWADAAPVRSFGYVAVLSVVGLMLAIGVYKLTNYTPLALFMFGTPLAVGVAQGWIPPWWMILWIIFAIGGWFAQRQTELG